MKRRNFIAKSALGTVGSLLVPTFLKGFDQPTLPSYLVDQGKILVVLQLSGGNDGLNTVVPFKNDLYFQKRPGLALKETEVLKLSDELGFHPSLGGLRALYDKGMVQIINEVGYPNPDRSHFRSMDIWQSGSGSDEYVTSGWLGRYLDSNCLGADCLPYKAIEVDDTLSMALKGNQVNGLAMADPGRLVKQARQPLITSLNKGPALLDEDNLGYLYKTLASTVSSAEYIFETSHRLKNTETYPSNPLGKQFKTISTLIQSGISTKVYYVSVSGFDTHADQLRKQSRVLQEVSDSLKAFFDDLGKSSLGKEVLVMAFSEFGRRVAENGSRGTDHGTAGPVFLISQGIGKKLEGTGPDLSQLDEGDLRYKTDFRDVYATLLQKWLMTSPDKIISGHPNILNIL